MSDNPDFLGTLLKIPYFATLAENNGAEWVKTLFEDLEVNDFDFSTLEFDVLESLGADLANFGLVPLPGETLSSLKSAGNEENDISDAAGLKYSNEFMSKLAEQPAPGRIESVTQKPLTGQGVFDNLPFDRDKFDHGDMDYGRYMSVMLSALAEYYKEMFSARADFLVLNRAQEHLGAGAGDDRFYAAYRGEADKTFDYVTIDGGKGNDSLYLYRDAETFGRDDEVSATGFTVVRLDELNDFGKHGGQVQIDGIENVYGSAHDDNIAGNDSDNILSGRNGNDNLLGGGGNDRLDGGGGDDGLDGGAGNDRLDGGAGKDILRGSAGNDRLSGGSGEDDMDGGGGDDAILGGSGDDTLKGGAGDDSIDGDAGEDTIDGGAGDDKIDGGRGIDKIIGGTGKDAVNGGDGDDDIDGGDGDDSLNGNAGKDKIVGGAGKDTIDGGAGDDDINGGNDDDTLNGGADKDKIVGGSGKDTITGGDGEDDINGGIDDDILIGSAGKDKLTGGDGIDIFRYALLADSLDGATDRDVIMDFDVTKDVFDFSALPGDPAGQASSLAFVGTAAFTNTKGEVRFEQVDVAGTADDRTLVQLDDDGDGTVDFEVELVGLHTLTVTNFDL